jgi:hypothetical protein
MTLSLLSGCGPTFKTPPETEVHRDQAEAKIEVEAYLFDAKLKRQGKPTSFRLEIFQTDSVIALGGRAYLGKGALKGRLTADSLEVYFPSSNEYLYEPLNTLLAATECASGDFRLNLLHLFQELPDSVGELRHVLVVADYANRKHPKFDLYLKDCPWRIEMEYDWENEGWRMREFTFDNGRDVTLHARRREYKNQARVPISKFQLIIPHDAVRLIP